MWLSHLSRADRLSARVVAPLVWKKRAEANVWCSQVAFLPSLETTPGCGLSASPWAPCNCWSCRPQICCRSNCKPPAPVLLWPDGQDKHVSYLTHQLPLMPVTSHPWLKPGLSNILLIYGHSVFQRQQAWQYSTKKKDKTNFIPLTQQFLTCLGPMTHN